MIEFAFVLLVSNTSLDESYVGNFKSCEVAQIHYYLHSADKYNGFRCIPKEYAYLPEHVEIINIDMGNGSWRYRDTKDVCKFKRDCTDV